MTVQQLLAQCSVEDIVRATMKVYRINNGKYQRVYTNYAELIDNLLTLEAVPTDDVLLGIIYEDDGELHMSTSVYKADQLARGIPYNTLLEESTDYADVSIEGWPDSYSYLFVPWAEVMGYQINDVNLKDVGSVPLLVDILYELTFFGFNESDMEAERSILDESIAEMKALQALTPEERFGTSMSLEELWEELDLPPQSPEEKDREHQAMRQQLFRNNQRTYRALRRYT